MAFLPTKYQFLLLGSFTDYSRDILGSQLSAEALLDMTTSALPGFFKGTENL